MNIVYVSLATLLYVLTAVDFIRKGDNHWALVWGGYAVANVGLMWASWRG